MTDFLAGGAAVASLAVALFFFRYWQRTHDRLFAAFSVAFVVFGANRVVIAAVDTSDVRLAAYVLRAAAFILIIVAIIDKNRSDR